MRADVHVRKAHSGKKDHRHHDFDHVHYDEDQCQKIVKIQSHIRGH